MTAGISYTVAPAILRSLSSAIIVVTALTTAEQASAQDTATDQRCAKGADVRRIEIRFADAQGGLPCKVIYRPEVESDTVGIVSWQNLQSVAACQAQANEVTERLAGEGWTCSIDDSPAPAAPTIALDETAADLAAADQDQNEPDRTIAAVPPTAEETPGAAGEGAGDGDSDGLSDDEVDVPARFVANEDLPPPSDDLKAMIEDDLARLDVTLDGTLEARIAAYGDINADDVDDALALFTYASPQPAYRQFLAAYVFDGDAYQLTATRPVSGDAAATMDARIETIDGGVIYLTLNAYEPDDAHCCPSGTRRLALALRELELVEIDAEAPTR